MAGNVSSMGQGTADASQNGFNVTNTLQILGGAVGVGGNVLGRFGKTATKQAEQAVESVTEATEAGGKAAKQAAKNAVRVLSSFDEFKVGRNFKSAEEALKAWEAYQQAAKAGKGIVIGHGDDALKTSFDGWQAFRMREDKWTLEINRAWIDGAIDAGLPVRLATTFDDVVRGSVTWDEIQRVITRGGTLVAF